MAGRLTEKGYWDESHVRLRSRDAYPRPRRHLMDCELDALFRAHLGPLRGGDVLEVGCGSSRWLPYFADELGLRVHGLDYSAAGIANARENLDRRRLAGDLIENDLFAQAATGVPQVDAIFSLGLLEHFPDPRAALRAMCRFARPGCIVVTLVPNVHSRILEFSCRLNPGLAETYNQLDLEAWKDVHRGCGLTLVEADYAQFFDWTWFNLLRLPPAGRRVVSWGFRLVGLPVLLGRRYLGLRPRSARWSSAVVVVARAS